MYFSEIDEAFQKIAEDGIFFDSGKSDKNRIIGFTSVFNLDVLENSKKMCCDGTFRVKRCYFRQLFIVHGEINGMFVPLVFAFMRSKSKLAYKKVFRWIQKEKVSNFQMFFLRVSYNRATNSVKN